MGRWCCFVMVAIFDFGLPVLNVRVQCREYCRLSKGVYVLARAKAGVNIVYGDGVQLLIADEEAKRMVLRGSE